MTIPQCGEQSSALSDAWVCKSNCSSPRRSSSEHASERAQLPRPRYQLPGISGLNLQCQLARANIQIPIIFITAHGDIPMTVRAMKAGAVEFLTKPFRDQDLLDAIQLALQRDRVRRQQESEIAVLRERFESLTPREREVVAMVVSGMLNKQIAAQIGTSENTVKVHRSRAMEKMQANSLADLVKMMERLQLPAYKSASD